VRRPLFWHGSLRRPAWTRAKFRVTNVEKKKPKGQFSGVIYIDLDEVGAKQLHQITKNNIEATMGVFVMGELVMHVTIKDEIGGGKLAISGGDEDLEATYKALSNNSEGK
jgi:preprotein translocase subunit SecD